MPDNRRDDSWRPDAACRDQPDVLFFGIPDRYGVDRFPPDVLAAAKALCERCPVREECLTEALGWGPDTFGVWGGATKAERERLLRRIRRAKCPVCAGTGLRDLGPAQVCGGCGHSWVSMSPGQVRASVDAA